MDVTRTSERYALPPELEAPRAANFELRGVVGKRVDAAVEGWLISAPEANPALTEMLVDRDRTPDRETVPWAGEFVGKHLISSIQALRLTRNADLQRMIEATVERVLAAQGDDGYLGPFAGDVRLVEKWDVWGHYHVMLALLLWHEETGDERCIEACNRIVALLHATFVDGERRMLTPDDADGEKNHAVAHALLRLHRVTGDDEPLALARWVEDQWDLPPAGQYISSALAGRPVCEFPAHRWESAHDWQAIGELAFLTGDESYRRAFEHIWWSILEGDRHNTGGFTSDEGCQGNPYHRGAIETCCTMAWIALSVDMLRMSGDSRVADEIELATLNGMVGGQHPSGRWWTYNTPMDGARRASAHDIVFQARAGSPELNCCSVNAPRGLGMIGEWAVMLGEDSVAVNYYGPSEIGVELDDGARLTVEQRTDYPLSPGVDIALGLEAPARFALKLRIPAWSAETTIQVNDDAPDAAQPGAYHEIEREWQPGDTVSLSLDFSPHMWVGDSECAGTASLYRGPLLLAYDPRYDSYDPDDIPELSLGNVEFAVETRDDFLAPWLLARVPTADGESIVLCDFASAGATGTTYRSWLPASGMEPAAFSREGSIWARRP